MQGSLCIIIINYKNAGDTVVCLKSVMSSDLPALPEVIIVENDQEGNTLDEITSFYPGRRILYPGKNLGYGKGVNLAIEYALNKLEPEYILILNNDVILQADSIGRLKLCAEKEPAVSYFTPLILTCDQHARIWYGGGRIFLSRMTAKVDLIGRLYGEAAIEDRYVSFASGCALMIRSSEFREEKYLYDPMFFMYDEDVELSLRLMLKGKLIMFVSGSVIFHKGQGSQSVEEQKEINQLSPRSNNLTFYLKNTIGNRYYITDKLLKGASRFKTRLSLTVYWNLKAVQYFLNFNFRAGALVLSEVFKGLVNGTVKKPGG